jgi:hypothetical protein
MITTSGNPIPSLNKNFPFRQLKLSWLSVGVCLVLATLYFLITNYESTIIDFYTRVFPEHSDKSNHYWSNLTDIFFNELVMLSLFTIATIYVLRDVNVFAIFKKSESILLRNTAATMYVFVAALFLLMYYTAAIILDGFPNSADEYAYVFQAETLSHGRFWDTPHPLKEFFDFQHVAQIDDKWVGRFPPGWPLVLAIAFYLGLPIHIMNPILAAITLIVLFRFTAKFYNEKVAIWSTLITALTGTFIYNSASFFSHTATLLEAVLFLHFLYAYLDQKKIYQALLSGFFLGMVAITRYYTAVLIFIPFVAYLLYHYKWQSIKTFVMIGIGALPCIAYLMWYQYSITGNPFVPVTMWAYSDEALGFVNGHSPLKGVEHLVRRGMMFIAWISPATLILYAYYIWKKIKDKKDRITHPEDYWLIFLAAGYFFYYHLGGNQYGPRFYYEAVPFVIIFIVSRIFATQSRWGYALLFTGLLYAIVKLPIISVHEHQVVKERQDVYELVKEKGIHNAVVFVSSGTGVLRPMPQIELARNDKAYQNDVIYSLDQKEHNEALMRYYPDKKFYYYKRDRGEVSGELYEAQPLTAR